MWPIERVSQEVRELVEVLDFVGEVGGLAIRQHEPDRSEWLTAWVVALHDWHLLTHGLGPRGDPLRHGLDPLGEPVERWNALQRPDRDVAGSFPHDSDSRSALGSVRQALTRDWSQLRGRRAPPLDRPASRLCRPAHIPRPGARAAPPNRLRHGTRW